MDESHYIFGTKPEQLTQTKEVKMRLPISHLIRLHGLKLLTGQNISDTVSKALAAYFAKADEDRHGAPEHAATAATADSGDVPN